MMPAFFSCAETHRGSQTRSSKPSATSSWATVCSIENQAELSAVMEMPQIVEGQMQLVVEMPRANGTQEIYVSDLSGTFRLSPVDQTFIIQHLRGTAR
jgi:hypothetical protein